MKIVFLNPSAQLGGAEAVLLDMLAEISELEPDWQLELIVSESGPLLEKTERLGIRCTVLPMPQALAVVGDAGAGGPAGTMIGMATLAFTLLRALPALVSYRAKLRRLLRRAAPDLIHTNGLKMHVLSVMAAGRAVPIVWHIHDYVGRRPLMSRALRRLAPRVSAAIANSESAAQDLRRVCGPALRVVPILNAVDLQRFTPVGPRADLDALSALPPADAGTLRVGILATMARWKGHALFLEAISLLSDLRDLRAYVIGGPIYRTRGSEVTLAELESLRDRLGLCKTVGFAGFVADTPAALRSLDLVVHASTAPEPFGLSIVEALACGRPVIASEEGGAAEILGMVEGAIGFPARNAAALAGTIRALAADRQELIRLGEAGRRSAERYFDRHRLGAAVAAVFREVTS